MNTLKQKIETLITSSLKEGKTELLSVYRDIKSQLVNAEKENKNQELDEPQSLKVVDKMAKARRQSIDLFVKGNRQDLADKEIMELSILETFLPKKLSVDEVKTIILEIIKVNSFATKKDMGQVIKKFNETYAGQSDGGTISNICKEVLV